MPLVRGYFARICGLNSLSLTISYSGWTVSSPYLPKRDDPETCNDVPS